MSANFEHIASSTSERCMFEECWSKKTFGMAIYVETFDRNLH
jgi:hypothetical protein